MHSPYLTRHRRVLGNPLVIVLQGCLDGMISFSRLQVSVIKVLLLLQLSHGLAGTQQTPINKGKMILWVYNCHVFQVLTGVPLNDYNPASARF